jgi:hypothetical protein
VAIRPRRPAAGAAPVPPGSIYDIAEPITVAFMLFIRCLASLLFGPMIVAMTHGRSLPS